MIDHIGLNVAEYARSKAFYVEALKPLGYEIVMDFEPYGVGFGPAGKPIFWVMQRTPRGAAHVAFTAADRATVERLLRGGTRRGRHRQRPARDPGALPPDLLRRVRARPGRPQHRGGEPRGLGTRLGRVPWDVLDGEQRELRDLVRSLARERIAPRAAEIDESHEFPWDVVELLPRARASSGCSSTRSYGGHRHRHAARARSRSRRSRRSARRAGSSSRCRSSARSGSSSPAREEQKERYLPRLASRRVARARTR